MNLNKFTLKAQEAIQKAVELAQNGNNQAIEPVHLLKAFLADSDSIINKIISKVGGNVGVLNQIADRSLQNLPKVQGASVTGQYLSNQTKQVFDAAQKE